MELSFSLTIVVSFLVSLAAAAPAAESNVALVELEKRATRPIVVDSSFNCDDNRHCIFLENGAALRRSASGARCVRTNERGQGLDRCRVSTISRNSVVCPNGDQILLRFGENFSSFDHDDGNDGNIRAIWSGQRRRNPNVRNPSTATHQRGADIYISCPQSIDNVFSKGDDHEDNRFSTGNH